MAKTVVTFRLDAAQLAEIRTIVEAERKVGRELTRGMFTRAALRLHIRNENRRLALDGANTEQY